MFDMIYVLSNGLCINVSFESRITLNNSGYTNKMEIESQTTYASICGAGT